MHDFPSLRPRITHGAAPYVQITCCSLTSCACVKRPHSPWVTMYLIVLGFCTIAKTDKLSLLEGSGLISGRGYFLLRLGIPPLVNTVQPLGVWLCFFCYTDTNHLHKGFIFRMYSAAATHNTFLCVRSPLVLSCSRFGGPFHGSCSQPRAHHAFCFGCVCWHPIFQ